MLRWGFILSILAWLVQLVAVPVGITYDGHVYIALADVIGSESFPEAWHPARTPLLPLSLKSSFSILGRQPLALLAVTAGLGLCGTLLVGLWVQKLAGAAAGALAVIVLAAYPTLAAYEHLVLTETGVFCVVSLGIWLLVCAIPRQGRTAWLRATALAVALSTGYLWRQNLIFLAPLFGIAHVAQVRRLGLSAALLQCALVVAVPWLTKVAWERVGSRDAIGSVVIRYGIVKQALIDPSDPLIGDEVTYRQAIEDCSKGGNFSSGLDGRRTDQIASIIRWPPEPAHWLLLRLAWTYPERYLAGCGRTCLLLIGGPAAVRENAMYRDGLLSASRNGSMIAEGPVSTDSMVRQQFEQRGSDSYVLSALRHLAPIYDAIIPAAMVLAGLIAPVALACGRIDWAIVGGSIWLYLLPFILTLSAVDRYGFPVQPIALALAVAAVSRLLPSLAKWKATRGSLATRTAGG